ncbi:MAG: efflux RND transporter permease subunit [Clostridiales bacterium]
MKKDAIYLAIKYRTVTFFIIILIVLSGIYSYHIMPRQEIPDVSAPIAKITTVYPGASPEDVEKLVTSKIEDKVSEISDYESINSYSNNNLCVVVVYLTNDADIEKSWNELRTKIDEAQNNIPEQCSDIDIDTNLIETAGMIISLSGDNYSYEELAVFAEKFEEELSRIEGISKFDITGKLEKQVSITVDSSQINNYDISYEDIITAIKASNVNIPSGTITSGDIKMNVSARGTYNSLKDIEDTVIGSSTTSGALVRLKDIANIDMSFADTNYKIKQNGKNAVLLTGYFKNDLNIVDVGDKVEKKYKELSKNLPEDVIIDQVSYQPKDVDKATKSFIISLLEGMLFVIIVVFIGMGIRNAIVVSTAIPVSILITFIFMQFMSIKLHQTSIAALIVSLGMIVDNAIVVGDSIQVRIDNGEDKLESCIKGTRETIIPILTSTLTTIAVFAPLLFLPGASGEYLKSVPQICIIALSASFLVANIVTPSMAYVFFRKSENKKHRNNVIRKFFRNLLELASRKKVITILIAIVIFTGAIFLAGKLGLQFFPKADKNIITIYIKAENNTDLSKTEDLVKKVEEILKKEKEVKTYTAAIGDGLPKFFFSLPTGVQSNDYAQLLVELNLEKGNKYKDNSDFVSYIQDKFDDTIVGAKVTVRELENGQPIGKPIQVQVSGDDTEELIKSANMVEDTLNKIKGTINVESDYSEKKYEYQVDVDNELIASMGLTQADIQKEISLALSGTKASIFRKDGKEYDIYVKGNINSPDSLLNLKIKSSITSQKIFLKQIGKVDMVAKTSQIKKYNKNVTVVISSDVDQGYSAVQIQNELQEKLKLKDLGKAYINYEGEKKQIARNFEDLGVMAVLAVCIIYIIIMIQFASIVQPLIIMITIPLSSIGSVIGLWIFSLPISFIALFGVVSLFGIVVNNAIILINHINNEREKKVSLENACLAASSKRFRPVMLTTITTAMGLLPLALSGSKMFSPMAITLMSGLILATLLTLVIIPVVYSLIYKVELKSKAKF